MHSCWGISSGVAILWKQHVHALEVFEFTKGQHQGRLAGVRFRLPAIGNCTIISMYGHVSDHEITKELIAGNFPYVGDQFLVMGDYNMDVSNTADCIGAYPCWSTVSWGDTCYSKTSASRVDHAIMTIGFKQYLKECNSLDTTLSTHRPIEAVFMFCIQVVKVLSFTRTPRKTFLKPHGPYMEFGSDWDQWSSTIAPIMDTLRNNDGLAVYGTLSTSQWSTFDLVWRAWTANVAKGSS